jgi:Flp pilus assembly pilin Flp
VTNLLKRFAKDEIAATSIQYCLISAGIGLAVFGAVKVFGPSLQDIFASLPSITRGTIQKGH